jgi:hypothetical protein
MLIRGLAADAAAFEVAAGEGVAGRSGAVDAILRVRLPSTREDTS